MTETHYFIAYLSPGGSTRAVATALSDRLRQTSDHVIVLDLAERSGRDDFVARLQIAERACLFVGSPVYRDMAVPPVIDFIIGLPTLRNVWGVPFVTWGLACSGVALWQMGSALIESGCRLAGAAKVAGVHSLMWNSPQPVGAGHPDDADLQQVRELADTLTAKFEAGNADSLTLADLDYQPPLHSRDIKTRIDQPRVVIPKTVHGDACNQCGLCETGCPVGAIRFNPHLEIGADCFDCFRCVRFCPENAIQPAVGLDQIETMIREHADTIQERPLTRIFVQT